MAKPKQKSSSAPSSKSAKGRRKASGGVEGVSGKSKKTFKKTVKRKAPVSAKKKEKVEGRARGVKRTAVTDDSDQKPVAKKSKASAATMATKKERRVYRKQQHKDFELVKESKVIWEHLRPHKSTPGKVLAREELMALAQGHFNQLVLKHDTARVVQSLLKNGTSQDRTAIFSELKEDIVQLSKLKYSKFVIKALLKYCSVSERADIISCLYGHVRKLIRHAEAAEIVELAYNDHANLKQRTALAQEFYGAEFALFKSGGSESMEDHSDSPRSLGDVLTAHPTRCKAILLHMKECILPLLNKSVVRHSIVHRALLDYLLHCTPEARSEMIECVREKVPTILHTKDGSRVAMQCIWHGSVKDRKIIVKSLKGLVCKVCQEENGHLLMLAIFDSVDDTVLVKKVLLSELGEHLEELYAHQYGRRVLLYLLAPRSSQHFSSQFLSLLTPGDGNAHTKKPAQTRRKELLEGVASPLLSLASANVVEWTLTSQHAPLLLEVASALSCDLTSLYEPLLERLCEGDGGEDHLVQHPCAHWVIKRLIAIDSRKREEGDRGIFVSRLVESADLSSWAVKSNRGAFVVCALVEVCEEVSAAVVDSLQDVADILGDSPLKGHEALYMKLNHHIKRK